MNTKTEENTVVLETEYFGLVPSVLAREFTDRIAAQIEQTITELHEDLKSHSPDTARIMASYTSCMAERCTQHLGKFEVYLLRNILKIPENVRQNSTRLSGAAASHATEQASFTEEDLQKAYQEAAGQTCRLEAVQTLNKELEREAQELNDEAVFLDELESVLASAPSLVAQNSQTTHMAGNVQLLQGRITRAVEVLHKLKTEKKAELKKQKQNENTPAQSTLLLDSKEMQNSFLDCVLVDRMNKNLCKKEGM